MKYSFSFNLYDKYSLVFTSSIFKIWFMTYSKCVLFISFWTVNQIWQEIISALELTLILLEYSLEGIFINIKLILFLLSNEL